LRGPPLSRGVASAYEETRVTPQVIVAATFARAHQTIRVTLQWKQEFRTMSGPSKKSLPSAADSERMVIRFEQLRQYAEAFKRTVEETLRVSRALIEDLRVGQATGRRHGRRMDEGDCRR
jgi:hypothetical protein